MKKWLAVLIGTAVCSAALAQITIIDEWDMNGNGTWQNSNNGVNLGGHYSSNNQVVAQIPDDGTFFFSPDDADGEGYTGRPAFTTSSDLTEGILRVSWSYTDMDWSVTTNLSNQVGFRVCNRNDNASEYVAIAFQAFATAQATNVWAYTKTSGGLGNISDRTGRLFLGLKDSGNPRTVTLELDYANSEVRMYADNWQWNGGVDVHTNVVDFATAGVTNISYFQTYYQNWGATNVTTMDNLRVELEKPTEDVYIVEQQTATTGKTPTTNNFSFAVEAGDVIAVLSASNLGSDPDTNSVAFSGSASLDEVIYNRRSAGASGHYWYTTAQSNGTVDVEFITVDSFNSIAAYQLRTGDELSKIVVLDTDKGGVGGAGATSITNTYSLGAATSGLFLEAFSCYVGPAAPLNTNTVIDVVNSSTQRIVAHGFISGTNEVVNIWTNGLDNVALIGIVFGSEAIPQSPAEYYALWLSKYPGLGASTNLTDHADSDNLDNLGEYAFDGNPLNGNNRGNYPVAYLTSDGGSNYLEYVYYERDDIGARGLSSILERSTDLGSPGWVTNGIETVGSGPSGIDGFNAVTNRIPTAGGDRQFLNLRIEFTP